MKILVIGGGSIGQRHIKNLQKLGYHRIWVLKRLDNKAFEDEHSVSVITNISQAFDIGINGIFICTPTSLHLDYINFAKENGIHIFMEKPLIHNSVGLALAKELLSDFKGVFFIGFMLRYHPLVKKIKEILKDGILGNAFSARFEFGSYLPYWHPWEDYRISYASRKEQGGGVINTISHELDLIQYFFGMPESVYCQGNNFGKLEIEVEEICDAIFNFQDKVVTLHLDYLQKDYDRRIYILCDNGKILWDWHTNQVQVFKHGEDPEVFGMDTKFEVNQLYLDEVNHFIKLTKENKRNHPLDFNHAVLNTYLLLKMHESNDQSKLVFL